METEIYHSSSGVYYVSDFIQKLSPNVGSKLIQKLEAIEQYSYEVLNETKTIIWLHGYRIQELRIKIEKVCYRIFCVMRNAVCFLVHAIKKKSNSTPLKDIKTAVKRVKDLDFRLATGQYKFA